MTDQRTALQRQFEPANRWATFGDILVRMRATGFRCHSDTVVNFSSPITAFCGLNGTGKSTLLQIAANAYGSPRHRVRPHYLRDFLVTGKLDPRPFSENATIEFYYWQEIRTERQLTITRKEHTKRWQGYRARPPGYGFFAGVGVYLPRFEQRDYVFRNYHRLEFDHSESVQAKLRESISAILSVHYDDIVVNTVGNEIVSPRIVTVNRAGTRYSEAHMGCGEGRIQYIVTELEALEDKALVVIEEPETSLHPSAQYNFGRYLVDVCIRKHHQILLTTHSDSLLEALPSQSRLYLNRTGNGVDVIEGITAAQAKSLMSEGYHKALNVLVEDRCAKAILIEIIRRIDKGYTGAVGIHPVGNDDTVRKAVTALRGTPLHVAGVLDGDMHADRRENIFKLPGTEAPEREMFNSEEVKEYILATYDLRWADFQAGLGAIDHHSWCGALADRVGQDKTALMSELARVYAATIPENEANSLVELLKEAARR